jgi:hypothetical protein
MGSAIIAIALLLLAIQAGHAQIPISNQLPTTPEQKAKHDEADHLYDESKSALDKGIYSLAESDDGDNNMRCDTDAPGRVDKSTRCAIYRKAKCNGAFTNYYT